jgi:C4-dicarboxylate-specific signal transduction histidine kinase
VLHNVGNVLNSLGVANTTARRSLKAMRVERLERASASFVEHRTSLAAFLTEDPHGRHLPEYLVALSTHISVNTKAVQAETDAIEKLIHHLRGIVSAQQASAKGGGLRERLDLKDVAELALQAQASELASIEVLRTYDELPQIVTDRHKLLQILVNLLSNARDAVQAAPSLSGGISIRIGREGGHAVIAIEDSGVGMSAELLPQLWRFGFTTKPRGHGFGLHSSAIAVRELGGTIEAYSAGLGSGSCFTVRLPIDDDPLSMRRLAA